VLLFAISIVALVLVSLMTPPPDRARLRDLTIATLQPSNPADRARERSERRGDVVLSILLALVIAAIWIIFSG
ncbi:MAG: Na+/glucose cotransporter, partial [Steroidobacteraceae bacterium]